MSSYPRNFYFHNVLYKNCYKTYQIKINIHTLHPCSGNDFSLSILPCNGLFTHRETDTGLDPYREGFPLDWLMDTMLCYEEIFTLHTKGDRSLSLNGYYSHFWDSAPSMDRVPIPSLCM